MSKILISTNRCSFVVFNTQTNEFIFKDKIPELETLDLKETNWQTYNPFGIEIYEGCIYVASNDKLCKFDLETFEYLESFDVPMYPDTHEIQIHNNILYITNSANDTITIYDLINKDAKFFSTINMSLCSEQPLNIVYGAGEGNNQITHVNSVYYCKNKLYFCLHNRNIKDSEIWCLNLVDFSCNMIYRGGRMNHSILISNDILCIV